MHRGNNLFTDHHFVPHFFMIANRFLPLPLLQTKLRHLLWVLLMQVHNIEFARGKEKIEEGSKFIQVEFGWVGQCLLCIYEVKDVFNLSLGMDESNSNFSRWFKLHNIVPIQSAFDIMIQSCKYAMKIAMGMKYYVNYIYCNSTASQKLTWRYSPCWHHTSSGGVNSISMVSVFQLTGLDEPWFVTFNMYLFFS